MANLKSTTRVPRIGNMEGTGDIDVRIGIKYGCHIEARKGEKQAVWQIPCIQGRPYGAIRGKSADKASASHSGRVFVEV